MNLKSQKMLVVMTLLLVAALSLAACGGSTAASDDGDRQAVAGPSTNGGSSSGDLSGAEIFAGLCSACHGPNAEGVEGLGKNLHESEFFADKTDEELVAFIAEGRPATHPDNTTGVDMPPRGGNPALTDEDLLAVVLYVRDLVGQ